MTPTPVHNRGPKNPAAATGASRQANRWALHDGVIFFVLFLFFFEPDWFLARLGGGGFLKRIPTLVMPLLVILCAHRWRRAALYWPLLLFVLIHVYHLPLAENQGLLIHAFKMLYQFVFVFVGVICLIRTPANTLRLLFIFMLSFGWFALNGFVSGSVGWHSTLSNPDSFGPLMCIGLGYCYCYGAARADRRWRLISYAVAGLCLIGVISSIARGAVLAAGLVLLLIWLRSTRRIATLGAAIGAAIVGLGAISVLHPGGSFWDEMSTVSEGTKSGTGQERLVMWGVSLEVFKEHPIMGVGANNVGAVAFRLVGFDPNRPRYADPTKLYNTKLHNIYFQVLSEEGLLGAFSWTWMIIAYFLQLRRLRAPDSVRYWRQASGGELDIALISRGLEYGMVGYLANGVFYNQIYVHWFWSLLAIAYVLQLNTGKPEATSRHPAGSVQTEAASSSPVGGREPFGRDEDTSRLH